MILESAVTRAPYPPHKTRIASLKPKTKLDKTSSNERKWLVHGGCRASVSISFVVSLRFFYPGSCRSCATLRGIPENSLGSFMYVKLMYTSGHKDRARSSLEWDSNS
ncbi:hypothetical protein VNO77_44015 [Canavalia gladiata]|uniref:Uncharacterized protein n=1 Tax=Canavalia gladiata TaxID=3824 RepID=A0AAN9PNE7_CANGL